MDRSLKVRFNVDGTHFDTLISDPTSTYYVEVNLDERSRGFRWFFSFYITFAADADGGAAKDAILLMDEPGLYLHIQSQKDLLAHWITDFDNQIIYTTHSPFMVPAQYNVTKARPSRQVVLVGLRQTPYKPRSGICRSQRMRATRTSPRKYAPPAAALAPKPAPRSC
jgi:hypothetical protein